MMFPQAMTGIRLTYAGPARARAIGWYAIALSAGAVVGQLAGGVLVEADLGETGWRAIFLVNVPVCLAAVAAAERCLPADGERVAAGLDLPGVGLLAGRQRVAIAVPLVVGQQQGWPVRVDQPGGRGAGLRAVPDRPAPRCRGRTPGAGHPRRRPSRARRPRAHRAGRSRHLDLLRPAVHAGPVRAAGDGPQPGRLRPGPGPGSPPSAWPGGWPPASRPGWRGRCPRPAAPCRPSPTPDQPQPVRRRAQRRAAAGPARGRRFRFGLQFATLIGHATNAVEARFAADVSGVTSTLSQLGGAIGVAGIGSLYLSVARMGGPPAPPTPPRSPPPRWRRSQSSRPSPLTALPGRALPSPSGRHRQKWARPGNSRPR